MRYPQFYDMYRDAIRNTWTVEEVDFSDDLVDLQRKLRPRRATPDQPAGRLLRHRRLDRVQQPGAQPLQARQQPRGADVPVAPALRRGAARPVLPDAARHLHPGPDRAGRGVRAPSRTSPRSARKGEFCFKWIDSINSLDELRTREDRKQFLLNLICFAACIEGLFFFGAFAYVYFLRSKGLLNGLASGTNWVFRDESCHMNFAFAVIEQVRREEPDLFDEDLADRVSEMIDEAVEVEYAVRRGPAQPGHLRACRCPTCASTCSSSPTSAW